MPDDRPLLDRRILIVEDDYFIANDMREIVERAGGVVVGPFANVGDASSIEAYAAADFAVLDINIKGDRSYDLADKLLWRGVPFCFATGYDADALPERFSKSHVIMKPFEGPELIKEIAQSFGRGA